MLNGMSHRPTDSELAFDRANARKLCRQLNTCRYDLIPSYLTKLLPYNKGHVEPPFICDYGYNITIWENCFLNSGITILDAGKVTIGMSVFIGPNCSILAATHPKDAGERYEFATPAPITIGHFAWIGGNVTLVGPITIGERSIIGAGSVVIHDVPRNEIWAGNPAKRIGTV
jgi:maltose O-acetyltransferase